MMANVRSAMVYAVGCGIAIGSCDPVRRSSIIGRCGAAILHLVVFNCRSTIAILAWRQHVTRYVHASIDCRVILDGSPIFFGCGSYRGIVDGNVLLFHFCKAMVEGAERFEDRKGAELLLMGSV